jgi:capsular polysaccharide biosynthesis protein
MKALSGQYVQWIRLQDDVVTAKDEYKAKKAELDQAQTAESVAEQKVFLTQFDTALLPDSPVRPILWVNTLVGAIVALLFATGYCFVADYLDHRFKTVEQAEQYLDLPVLGSVSDLGRRIISRR